MSDPQEETIMGVVSESRYRAMFVLRTIFGTEELSPLIGWEPVIIEVQELPIQFIDEIVPPIINRFFEEENLNPTAAGDRNKAMPFASVIAAGIKTAAHVVFQQMQAQQQQKQRTRSKLLGGGNLSM